MCPRALVAPPTHPTLPPTPPPHALFTPQQPFPPVPPAIMGPWPCPAPPAPPQDTLQQSIMRPHQALGLDQAPDSCLEAGKQEHKQPKTGFLSCCVLRGVGVHTRGNCPGEWMRFLRGAVCWGGGPTPLGLPHVARLGIFRPLHPLLSFSCTLWPCPGRLCVSLEPLRTPQGGPLVPGGVGFSSHSCPLAPLPPLSLERPAWPELKCVEVHCKAPFLLLPCSFFSAASSQDCHAGRHLSLVLGPRGLPPTRHPSRPPHTISRDGLASYLTISLLTPRSFFSTHTHPSFLRIHTPHRPQPSSRQSNYSQQATHLASKMQTRTTQVSTRDTEREHARHPSFLPLPLVPPKTHWTPGAPRNPTQTTHPHPITHPPTHPHTHRTSASTQFFLPPPAAPACPPSSPLLSNARSP